MIHTVLVFPLSELLCGFLFPAWSRLPGEDVMILSDSIWCFLDSSAFFFLGCSCFCCLRCDFSCFSFVLESWSGLGERFWLGCAVVVVVVVSTLLMFALKIIIEHHFNNQTFWSILESWQFVYHQHTLLCHRVWRLRCILIYTLDLSLRWVLACCLWTFLQISTTATWRLRLLSCINRWRRGLLISKPRVENTWDQWGISMNVIQLQTPMCRDTSSTHYDIFIW